MPNAKITIIQILGMDFKFQRGVAVATFGLLALTALCTLTPAHSAPFDYVDEGPSDIVFVIRKGELVKTDQGGRVVQRMEKVTSVSANIMRVGSIYYCKWQGFAETQASKYASKRWWCTPRGIELHPEQWPQLN